MIFVSAQIVWDSSHGMYTTPYMNQRIQEDDLLN